MVESVDWGLLGMTRERYNLSVTSRRVISDIDESVLKKMGMIDAGKWTVNDILESMIDEEEVDETSTAASVGDGIARPVGGMVKDRYEKLKRSYESYLQKTGKNPNKKDRTESSLKEQHRGFLSLKN